MTLQDLKLPTTLGNTYRASACAWTSCGRFLLTSWQGGMGMLTMHEVRHQAAHARPSCSEQAAVQRQRPRTPELLCQSISSTAEQKQ